MGRHRRSAAGRAATGRATGVTENNDPYTGGHDPQDSYAALRFGTGTAPYLHQEEYSDTNARSSAYLFATEGDYARFMDTTAFPVEEFTPAGGSSGGGHRRRKKGGRPVATGLLGVSAAVAIGTVAVASGVVPGLENYKLGGTSSTGGDRVQAAGVPSNTASEQGGTSGSAESRGTGSSTSRDTQRSASPAAPASPSASASKSASASPTPTKPAAEKPTPSATPSTEKPAATPSRTATKAPARAAAPITVSQAAAAEAEVLKLVNEERAKVGCSALSANSSLTKLAETFSEDMAARDFFDHTDPDGKTPWDRAAAAGISNLGGENIARGQADAQAVMDAWMNSEGHRANILNCDFKTLGVGVHFGAGGPWWTQDFGY
ncbi:CAP domain-containing protein [Streptomyces arenae]|uniref:CAP domain-containing protein n=1 Tax=Streptomyces arenae TaxID=29301 RepID=UPI002658E7F6|nr:CAP domain-containing protein [Streptomyces arenae]MCG7207053.1 CAP domain-containing protein [Streptomyces arenae]